MEVLVELAMNHAEGGGDGEIENVMSLNAASVGYSSLIYKLPMEAGYRELLECCKPLWRALETDKKLPNKLVR